MGHGDVRNQFASGQVFILQGDAQPEHKDSCRAMPRSKLICVVSCIYLTYFWCLLSCSVHRGNPPGHGRTDRVFAWPWKVHDLLQPNVEYSPGPVGCLHSTASIRHVIGVTFTCFKRSIVRSFLRFRRAGVTLLPLMAIWHICMEIFSLLQWQFGVGAGNEALHRIAPST